MTPVRAPRGAPDREDEQRRRRRRPRSARARRRPTSGRAASRARRGTTRRAAACRRTGPGQEAERPARDESPRERVALLDVLLEDLLPLDPESDEPRQRGGRGDEEERRAWYALRDARPRRRNGTQWSRATSNDRSTTRSGRRSPTLQRRRPGGFAVAALMRPPDAEAGEHDEELWLARAREAAGRGPLGHHTHFTSPTHARPTGGDTGARVRREGGLARATAASAPTLFCGGGWYTDRDVARGLRGARLRRLHPAGDPARRTCSAARPGRSSRRRRASTLDGGALPRRADDARRRRPRAVGRRGPGSPTRVHAYFHDTDLLDGRRRALIVLGAAAPRPPPARDRSRRGSAGSCATAPVRRLDGRRARRARRQPGVESRRAERGAHDSRSARPRRLAADPTPADVRRSRVYLLSRGPLSSALRRRVSVAALVAARRRRARARPLRRARPPRPRLRRHGLLVAALGRPGPAEWLPFLAPITVLVFLQAGLYAPRERRAGPGGSSPRSCSWR